MVTLVLGNSYCRVLGLSPENTKRLKYLLSYDIGDSAAYYSNSFHNRKRSLLTKRGEFPSGLLYIVKKFLSKAKYEVKDNRVKPSRPHKFKLNMTHAPRIGQKASSEAAVKFCKGTIVQPTGYGKTVSMALAVSLIGRKALIVVPNLTLKRQTQADMDRLLGKGGVKVENIDSSAIETFKDFDVLIIDEAHHSAAKTYRRLNRKCWDHAYYRLCYTATPFRSRNEEQLLMESLTGPVIHRVTYAQAVDEGAVLPVEAYYFEVPKTKTKGYTWQEVYRDLVVNNTERNFLIAEIMNRFIEAKVSTLCLVKEIKHGENLMELTTGHFVYGDNAFNEKLLSKFNTGGLLPATLIATTGIVGEGVDTKPCEFVIIAGLGKSRSAFMQQVGRALRTHPGKNSAKVIIFSDKSHRWCKTHFREQCKILKEEYGVTPIKI